MPSTRVLGNSTIPTAPCHRSLHSDGFLTRLTPGGDLTEQTVKAASGPR
ncbi:hypothetical protein BN903_49 [Halorubrum sp. AJ67]|nr:hypothetical protein BN903_49 [Halorubrum sp. AJ67]